MKCQNGYVPSRLDAKSIIDMGEKVLKSIWVRFIGATAAPHTTNNIIEIILYNNKLT